MWGSYLLRLIHTKFKMKKAYFALRENALWNLQLKCKINSHKLLHKRYQKQCPKFKRSKKLNKKIHQKDMSPKAKSQKTLVSTLFKRPSQ